MAKEDTQKNQEQEEPRDAYAEGDVTDDSITCSVCSREFDREAPEGVTLQPSPGFVCEDCQAKHDEESGELKAEEERNEEIVREARAASERPAENTNDE